VGKLGVRAASAVAEVSDEGKPGANATITSAIGDIDILATMPVSRRSTFWPTCRRNVGRDDAGKAAQRHSLNAAGATGNAKEKVAPHHQYGITTQAEGRRPQMVHYCAAKAGVTGFTTFLAALRHHCSTAIRRSHRR
jgi:NAD(P)-dependent dehydrogenase (short-subunit alcohol dehydrogenase family)